MPWGREMGKLYRMFTCFWLKMGRRSVSTGE